MKTSGFSLSLCSLGILLAGCGAYASQDGADDGYYEEVDYEDTNYEETSPEDSESEAPEGELGTLQSALMSKTGNATGSNNNYFYTFWKDGGSVNMSLPSQPPLSGEYAGNFAVTWQSGTYNFVGGKGWSSGSSNRTINYNCGAWATGSSNAYLTLYGRTTGPLVEYYIVDSWGSWRPPGATSAGRVTTDGGTYDLYKTRRYNAPNITGRNQDFDQYWSVRTSKRTAPTGNVKVTFANHRNAWAGKGWQLGSHNYQVLATEVFNPASAGASNCTVW